MIISVFFKKSKKIKFYCKNTIKPYKETSNKQNFRNTRSFIIASFFVNAKKNQTNLKKEKV